jgi:plastocyanin/methionine-rich copper-binding protein CopC
MRPDYPAKNHIVWLSAVLIWIVALTLACGDEDQSRSVAVLKRVADQHGADVPMEKADVELPDMIVAPHFVDAYPVHGDLLTQTPEEIVLNFNFTLQPDSAVKISRDGKTVQSGTVDISENRLSMRAPFAGSGGDGIYRVDYKACWPDGSCHDGTVGFVVDSSEITEFVDLRGESAVTIRMIEGLRFDVPRILISTGTTVTWVNDDSIDHFVNSDPHPSHNLLGDLNSLDLAAGAEFTFTFDEPGAWGYHCSAHFNRGMIAQVVVQ